MSNPSLSDSALPARPRHLLSGAGVAAIVVTVAAAVVVTGCGNSASYPSTTHPKAPNLALQLNAANVHSRSGSGLFLADSYVEHYLITVSNVGNATATDVTMEVKRDGKLQRPGQGQAGQWSLESGGPCTLTVQPNSGALEIDCGSMKAGKSATTTLVYTSKGDRNSNPDFTPPHGITVAAWVTAPYGKPPITQTVADGPIIN